ncbi:peptidoglycan/LPS O-acetylase OafA/YrhL [Silvibacterium bohemicum]|uniref:Peptidoglycan/LPS O-acetylase OafA/YrhL n=1 Tax=Silvibacterium bohemicum TaxID=1577686 RepID=A0A841JPI9_9BACT|nr:acyltransferase [Silvibacterium bohemicum]MBB6143223.1 peptidoglycan/LPS O-acetylase OafA/YrhL [Silvibacterium bohemicum]
MEPSQANSRSAAVSAIASAPVRREKKELLPALTGLRCFAALNIVFFHFSNPKWFGPFAPVVDNGYTSVSFFLLMSGYILAYNYADRAAAGQLDKRNFWIARFSRLYPVYVFALLLSLGMLVMEWQARSHAQFALGVVLTPLLLQAWSPMLATFWNTPAWTMCTEAFFYLIFPAVILWKRPRRIWPLLGVLAGLWLLGMVLPSLYMWLHPDGDLHPGRYTDGFWIRALKFTPPPHVPAFLFGIALADLDGMIPRSSWRRLLFGVAGMAGLYTILYFGDRMPYPLMHDGLLMPLFGLAILGLAGHNLIARFFGFPLFVAIGRASYCLYIIHFNLWNLIHDSHILDRLHLAKFDPWLSYFLLVSGAILVMLSVERPCQRWIRSWALKRT